MWEWNKHRLSSPSTFSLPWPTDKYSVMSFYCFCCSSICQSPSERFPLTLGSICVMFLVTLHCWDSKWETKVFHTIYTTHILYLICLNTRIRVQRLMQRSMYTSWLNYRWAGEMRHSSSNLIARGKTPALLRKYLHIPSILPIINKQNFQGSLGTMKEIDSYFADEETES